MSDPTPASPAAAPAPPDEAAEHGMRLTFLGHQSWLVSSSTHHIAVDPIVEAAFGTGAVEYRVWPPRTIQVSAMPQPDAIVITHEHLDHVHLPSLARFDPATPVFTGVTVPAAVVAAVEELGFNVQRVGYTAPFDVGDINVTLFPASGRTLFWESRVAQPCFRLLSDDGAFGGGEVFIAVDAAVSDVYLDKVRDAERRPPRVIVVSNNAETVPFGAAGSDANLLPGTDGPARRTSGVEILHSLLGDYLDGLDVADVALCGNGWVVPNSPFGPFMYADHRRLAAQANELQHTYRVHGPRPGDQLVLPADGDEIEHAAVPWVRIDRAEEQAGLKRLNEFVQNPRRSRPEPLTEPIAVELADVSRMLVDRELEEFAAALLHTSLGTLAVGMATWVNGPLDADRLVLRLLDPPGEKPGAVESWVWDVTGPAMRRVPSVPRGQVMSRYPFGIEVYYSDFVAMLQGRVQVWDVVAAAYQGWHAGENLDSPIFALFAIFGEHHRPDLARRCYRNILDQIEVDRAASHLAGQGVEAVAEPDSAGTR